MTEKALMCVGNNRDNNNAPPSTSILFFLSIFFYLKHFLSNIASFAIDHCDDRKMSLNVVFECFQVFNDTRRDQRMDGWMLDVTGTGYERLREMT